MREWKSLGWSKSSELVEILSRGPECEERRQLLLEAGEQDSRGRTLLHWAAVRRQATLVRALLLALPNAAIDWQDHLGRIPLMALLKRRGSSRSVRDIIPLLTWSNLCLQDVNGKTGMHFVAEKMSGVLAAEAFCESFDDCVYKECFDITDNEGNNAFHALARQHKPTRWSCWSRQPLEGCETAATVLARFFTLKSPESLQATNRKGDTPLETLALANHHGALVAAVEVAPAEALLFKNERGATFLSTAAKSVGGLLEAVVLAMPVDMLLRFGKDELLGHGEAARSPFLAALRSYDHAMAIIEMLADAMPKSYDWTCVCTRAAEIGSYRILLRLWRALEAASIPARRHNPLIALSTHDEWNSPLETEAAEEILRTGDAEEFTLSTVHGTVVGRALLRGMPPFLAEIILSRLPEDYLSGKLVMLTSLNTRADKLEVLVQYLAAGAFDEPFLINGLADTFHYVSPDFFERVLEMCSDEAFNPSLVTDHRGTLLHIATRSRRWEYLVPLLLARAPHVRYCTNEKGLTALESEQHYNENTDRCKLLAALCGIGSSAKNAALS